jgi:hypothetical protein
MSPTVRVSRSASKAETFLTSLPAWISDWSDRAAGAACYDYLAQRPNIVIHPIQTKSNLVSLAVPSARLRIEERQHVQARQACFAGESRRAAAATQANWVRLGQLSQSQSQFINRRARTSAINSGEPPWTLSLTRTQSGPARTFSGRPMDDLRAERTSFGMRLRLRLLRRTWAKVAARGPQNRLGGPLQTGPGSRSPLRGGSSRP